jgi:hypothetical protein
MARNPGVVIGIANTMNAPNTGTLGHDPKIAMLVLRGSDTP